MHGTFNAISSYSSPATATIATATVATTTTVSSHS